MARLDPATWRAGTARRLRAAAGGGRVGTGSGRPFASAESWDDSPAADAAAGPGEVVVGVVDTGLTVRDGLLHPFLEARRDRIDFVGNAVEPDAGAPFPAEFGHGTFVTGLILRQAPGCRVLLGRGLLEASADGAVEDAGIASLIEGFVARGVQLINLSLAGGRAGDAAEGRIVEALQAAAEAGVLVVCAVSNNPSAAGSFPADLADPDGPHPELVGTVLPVVAGDETMRRTVGSDALVAVPGDGRPGQPDDIPEPPSARFAWQPEGAHWLRCRANGVAVLGPYPRWDAPFAGWARWSGSSFAAAQFSGFLANETMVRSPAEPGITPRRVASSLDLFTHSRYYYSADSRWRDDPERA